MTPVPRWAATAAARLLLSDDVPLEVSNVWYEESTDRTRSRVRVRMRRTPEPSPAGTGTEGPHKQERQEAQGA